jgi:hypothetical protein
MICTPLSSFADYNETLDTLKSKAVSASVDLLSVDSGLMTLQENLARVLDARGQLRELYDAYKQYRELYEKGAHLLVMLDPALPGLTPEQIQQIMVNNQIKLAYMKLQATFQALYGISTPSLTQEQIYTNFISTADVLPLQLIGQSNNLRIDRQRAEASIRNGVETLWWNLGSLRVQKNLTEDYALLVKAQLNLTEVQYKLGKASQLDLDMKKLELETARSNDRRMEREIENLELRLRDLAGLEYAEDFSVSITAYNTASVTLLSYEDYMRLALRTRVDAIRALQTIDVIRQEENIMSAYITDAANSKRREVRIRRLEAEQAYNKLIRFLDAEIYGVYDGVVSAKENLDAMQLRFFLAKKDLARLKALFDQGYLSAINYEGAKLSLTQAEINYENAQYQFNLKIQQLNHIVTYGGSTGGGA